MSSQFISVENLKFLLHKVHKIDDLFQYPYYSEYNKEAIDMVVDSALDFSNKELFPYLVEMDQQGVSFKDGKVSVHPQVYKVLNKLGEAGFLNASLSFEEGGVQLPYMAHYAASIIYTAANNGGIGYTGLTAGAAHLIVSFGNEELKKTYAEKMYQGIWQGTMAMTEPEAGSSLSDITTKAIPTETSGYKISGQKIFISGGDYDDAENIVHLTLARIEGAPSGTKGISLFVVPKLRVEEDGSLRNNDVTTAGIFHKLGQHGYVTTHLMMGEKNECIGYLVGEENMGLKYMFQMMNSARIEVGLAGVSIASAAYYAALEYTQERRQGRHPSSKDSTSEPVKIIEHADVRRMLFMQKSMVEGCASLVLECAKHLDLSKSATGEEQENSSLLLELLTPIVKAYPTEMGIQAVSNGVQCLGGYGYCQDFPLEQLYRDIRITTLYEGTTGIQSLDLLGRKMLMANGKGAKLLFNEIISTIGVASGMDVLSKYAGELKANLQEYQKVMTKLMSLAQQGKLEEFLADANLFMELTGNIVLGWQWLKQGVIAAEELEGGNNSIFYTSKIETLKYYFTYELPKCKGLMDTLINDESITLPKEEEHLI
jgi:alkylation response protein AidB-like acyl-CoA dehydrogenase